MGMSTHVYGIRDMDGKYKKMMEVKQFCDSRGVSYPEEVRLYFGHKTESEMLEMEIPSTEYLDDSSQGIEIEVKDIPKEVKTIRFVNSY